MGFMEVFRSLQEVFPQVDLRILKAVAIEHSKDVDAAVEFILYEVLPSISRPPEPPYNINDTLEEKDSFPAEGPVSAPCESAPDVHSRPDNVRSPDVQSIGEDLHVGFITQQNQQKIFGHHDEVSEEANVSVHLAMEHEVPATSDCTGEASHFKSGGLVETTLVDRPSHAHVGDDHVQLFSYGEPKGISSANDAAESQMLSESGSADFDVSVNGIINSEGNGIVSVLKNNAQNLPLEILGKDTNIALEANGTSCANFVSAQDSSSVPDKSIDSMVCGTMVFKDVSSLASEYEEQLSNFVSKNGEEIFSFETDMVSVEADNQPSAVASRSAQVVSVDMLEEFIVDAKNNKKILASAMESVIDMMKEVDFSEKRAKQAKDEALVAGQDILYKVDELGEMLKHAKEANEMHSGEVYGEKSILATEARVLQSRLLSLSDERDKSLLIIEEIRQRLEERLAAAEEELAAAEQEKLEKEEFARKALKEQELVMETIVQESKRLQQEAEENSKLRECLLACGHMVDALQGEVAVICEDVISLKNRVDNRMPLGKSVSSNGSLASSLSSSHHKSVSSNETLHPVELAESPEEINHKDPLNQQLVSYAKSEKEIHHNIATMLADGDWEIFDGTDGKFSW